MLSKYLLEQTVVHIIVLSHNNTYVTVIILFCIQSKVHFFHLGCLILGEKNKKLYFQADIYFLLVCSSADIENISH